MISFNDWDTKNKKKKEYTITKSSSGLPLFVLDNPLQKDDEPVKTIPKQVSDYITKHF